MSVYRYTNCMSIHLPVVQEILFGKGHQSYLRPLWMSLPRRACGIRNSCKLADSSMRYKVQLWYNWWAGKTWNVTLLKFQFMMMWLILSLLELWLMTNYGLRSCSDLQVWQRALSTSWSVYLLQQQYRRCHSLSEGWLQGQFHTC